MENKNLSWILCFNIKLEFFVKYIDIIYFNLNYKFNLLFNFGLYLYKYIKLKWF